MASSKILFSVPRLEVALLASLLTLAPSLPARAAEKAGATCRLRGGAWPVVGVHFAVEDPRLAAQLFSKKEEVEDSLATSLAANVGCIHELRFLDWAPHGPGQKRPPVTLHGSLHSSNGEGIRDYEIWLKLEAEIDGKRYQLDLPPLLLYGRFEDPGPGPGGRNWKERLATRFSKLFFENQVVPTKMFATFKVVPLARAGELLVSGEGKVITLPIRARDLEAEPEKTKLRVLLEKGSEVSLDQCLEGNDAMKGRLQCSIGEKERFNAATNKRKFDAIRVSEYSWMLPRR